MNEIPMGHGVEGVFGGLPEEFSELENSKVVIIPVPFDKTTTFQQGADRGPDALIEASRNLELYDIETNLEAYKAGIYTASPIVEDSSESMLSKLEKECSNYLAKGKFVLTLGGEHSISQAPIRAHAKKFPKLTVLQFDAHADLQDAYEDNPLSHASVMARVLEIPEVDRIVAVGIRSMDKREVKNLKKENTFFAHEIAHSSDWISNVMSRLGDQVYITFDLDVFDSSIMPATGTPEPGGLNWYQCTDLLKKVIEERQLIGCDIVELMPLANNKAPEFLAAKLVYKILSYKIAKGF